jgi:hypothetical protein
VPFAKLDVSLRTDERWELIPERHRADAVALFLAAVLYSAEMLADGRLDAPVLIALANANGSKRARFLIARLVDSGHLRELGSGRFEIASWHDFHSSRAEVEEGRRRSTERKRRSRGQLVLPDVTPDVTVGQTADVTAGQVRDSRAHARRRTASAAETEEDLALLEPQLDSPDELEDPAAAEPPRESEVQELAARLPGWDTSSLAQVLPLASALPAGVFRDLVATVEKRRNVENPIGLLVRLMRIELRGRAAQASLEAAAVPAPDSGIRQLRKDPDRYVREVGFKLPDDVLDEVLLELLPADEGERIRLADLAAELRRAGDPERAAS